MNQKTSLPLIFGVLFIGLFTSLSFTYQGFVEYESPAEPMSLWEENEVEKSTFCATQYPYPKKKSKCVDRFHPERITKKSTPHQVSKTLVKVTHCKEGESGGDLAPDHQKISPNQSLKASLKRFSIEGSGGSTLSGEAYTYTIESFEISIHQLSPTEAHNAGELHSHIFPGEIKKSGVHGRSLFRLWSRFRPAKKSV